MIPDVNGLLRVPDRPVTGIDPIVARPPRQPAPALAADELGCPGGGKPGSDPPPPLHQVQSVPVSQPQPSPVDEIEHALKLRIREHEVGIASRKISPRYLADSIDGWGRLLRVKTLTGRVRWQYNAQKQF
jgi:hypothetical protein